MFVEIMEVEEDIVTEDIKPTVVTSCFKSEIGEPLHEGVMYLPLSSSVNVLQTICNSLLQQEKQLPLAFFINNIEITDILETYIDKAFRLNEGRVDIVYQPQAVFKVRAVTRCTGSLEGKQLF